MGAEAVVVLNPQLATGIDYLRKTNMALGSKMRFISASSLCTRAICGGDRHSTLMKSPPASGMNYRQWCQFPTRLSPTWSSPS